MPVKESKSTLYEIRGCYDFEEEWWEYGKGNWGILIWIVEETYNWEVKIDRRTAFKYGNDARVSIPSCKGTYSFVK